MIGQFALLIKSLVALTWPVILAVLLWKLFPEVKRLVVSRAFTIKVAGMEISVQDATEQIRIQLDDLQKQVIALRSGSTEAPSEIPEGVMVKEDGVISKRLLWVDDRPKNIALEIAQLQDRGFEVVQSQSTQDAMRLLNSSRSFAAVISDMGRMEDDAYRAQAGIVLLTAIRRAGYKMPFLVYSAKRYVARNREEVIAAGGDGASASAVELFEWVERVTARSPN